jgi:hypothetical protein
MSRTKEIFTKEGTVTKRLAMILGIVMGMVIAATSMANTAYAMGRVRASTQQRHWGIEGGG